MGSLGSLGSMVVVTSVKRTAVTVNVVVVLIGGIRVSGVYMKRKC